MLMNMPYPRAVDIDGVAYIGPRAALTFLLANGTPIDDIVVRHPTSRGLSTPSSFSGTVHHVHQCREAVKWIKRVEEEYFCGAPNTSNSGAPKFPVVIGIAITDWSDGFGSGK